MKSPYYNFRGGYGHYFDIVTDKNRYVGYMPIYYIYRRPFPKDSFDAKWQLMSWHAPEEFTVYVYNRDENGVAVFEGRRVAQPGDSLFNEIINLLYGQIDQKLRQIVSEKRCIEDDSSDAE